MMDLSSFQAVLEGRQPFAVVQGNSFDVLRQMECSAVDACVTDPPYGLTSITNRFGKDGSAEAQFGKDGVFQRTSKGFMSQEWDGQGIEKNAYFWRCLWRTLKPGAHCLAFGGTRTMHRITCAIEDAGFEIRDSILCGGLLAWGYGTGFPKSKSVEKDLARIGEPSAKEWEGWGSALKPAWEPVLISSKSLQGKGKWDTIDVNLYRLEARLWSLLPANIAEEIFELSPSEFEEVLSFAQWSAVERSNTQVALLAQMDTSLFVSVMNTCLSTVQLWRASLADLSCQMSTFTTEIRSSLTTDLKTLSCLLYQTTAKSMAESAMTADGQKLNALPVAQFISAVNLKLNVIHTDFAVESVTSKAHTLPQAGAEASKPSWKPILCARKPLSESSVARNVLQHGTGAINIVGCRVGYEERPRLLHPGGEEGMFGLGSHVKEGVTDEGRWPPNLLTVHSPGCVPLATRILTGKRGDTLTPNSHEGTRLQNSAEKHQFGYDGEEVLAWDCAPGCPCGELDKQSGDDASRYFPQFAYEAEDFYPLRYEAKPGRSERDRGAERLAVSKCADPALRDGGRGKVATNGHPTVKPTALMKWLCRLVTPPGGIILDPFCGSGTTGVAALKEGFRFIGIEQSEEYCRIARARIEESRIGGHQLSLIDEVA